MSSAFTINSIVNLEPIQTQIDAKQATLVSGTNIKTVNGTSILGSGDLSAGSSRGALSGFGIKPVTGIDITNTPTNGARAIQSYGATAAMVGAPFRVDQDLTISAIGVTTASAASAGATLRMLIYECDSELRPDVLLWQGSLNLPLDVANTRVVESLSFTFQASKNYVIAHLQTSNSTSLRAIPAGSALQMGASGLVNNFSSFVRGAVGTSAPSPFAFTSSDLNVIAPPAYFMVPA